MLIATEMAYKAAVVTMVFSLLISRSDFYVWQSKAQLTAYINKYFTSKLNSILQTISRSLETRYHIILYILKILLQLQSLRTTAYLIAFLTASRLFGNQMLIQLIQ